VKGLRRSIRRRFRDRVDAGRLLAGELCEFARRQDVIVLGLPRGGVAVAFQVAAALGVPMDVLIVRKLGVPGHHELAMGALASGGVCVLNADVIAELGITEEELRSATTRERLEVERRERLYRGGTPSPDLRGRTVIIVDDGIATGATARAAIDAVYAQAAKRVVIAVPVAPRETCAELAPRVDEFVCMMAPERFIAVGSWYEEFSECSDDTVREFVGRAHELTRTLATSAAPSEPAGSPASAGTAKRNGSTEPASSRRLSSPASDLDVVACREQRIAIPAEAAHNRQVVGPDGEDGAASD
jgi:putative phosphoribosyl transferase